MTNGKTAIFKPDGKNAIHDGIEHAPGAGKALLDPTDTVLLLLDHQSGLFQNVKDVPVAELRANVTALAKLATLQGIPVITTASVPDGPNGQRVSLSPVDTKVWSIPSSNCFVSTRMGEFLIRENAP